MTTWKGDRPLKADAIIAKNYLTEPELVDLDQLTTQFLDFAEGQARRRLVTTMAQWVETTDRLLTANQYHLLHRGTVAHTAVEEIVDDLWPTYAERRRELDRAEATTAEVMDLTELLQLEHRRDEGSDT
ncbi:MAG: virulence RhuM family protein [Micrococcales bacterium]|nr:virulence RhuM family protein [Micrococcales bacterium]